MAKLVKKKKSRKDPWLKLLTDSPVEDLQQHGDGLQFDVYAKMISRVILDNNGPLTFGIYGRWGSGKTTLMHQVENRLNAVNLEITTIWFNPWEYENIENPLIPMAKTILAGLGEENEGRSGRLKHFLKMISLVSISTAALAIGDPASAFLGVDQVVKLITSGKVDEKKQQNLDAFLSPSPHFDVFQTLNEPNKVDKKVVVFIDDLDRCLSEKALRIIEAIKLVFDLPDFIFVIGLDKLNLDRFISERFQTKVPNQPDINEAQYLDKLIQVSFPIPTHADKHAGFWKSIHSQLELTRGSEEEKDLESVFNFSFKHFDYNPRKTKNIINNILIDRFLFQEVKNTEEAPIPVSIFLVTRTFKNKWNFYRELFSNDAEQNSALELLARNIENEVSESKWKAFTEEHKRLGSLWEKPKFKKLICTKVGLQWLKAHDARGRALSFYLDREAKRIHEESKQVLLIANNSVPNRMMTLVNQKLIKAAGHSGIQFKTECANTIPYHLESYRKVIFLMRTKRFFRGQAALLEKYRSYFNEHLTDLIVLLVRDEDEINERTISSSENLPNLFEIDSAGQGDEFKIDASRFDAIIEAIKAN
ncbi:MAG: P-loop NTPase fold protein [Bacteroidota bacterium]